MKQAKQILMSHLRSKHIDRSGFARLSDQIGSLLAFESLNYIPVKAHAVDTPINTYHGIIPQPRVVLVAILRSGLALLKPFSEIYPNSPSGFFGFERDTQSKTITTYYQKLPRLSQDDYVIVLDPVLATGITACEALQKLSAQGVQQTNILFVSMLACKTGLEYVRNQYPHVAHITAATDENLTSESMISPGLGDFGDRYFQTTEI